MISKDSFNTVKVDTENLHYNEGDFVDWRLIIPTIEYSNHLAKLDLKLLLDGHNIYRAVCVEDNSREIEADSDEFVIADIVKQEIEITEDCLETTEDPLENTEDCSEDNICVSVKIEENYENDHPDFQDSKENLKIEIDCNYPLPPEHSRCLESESPTSRYDFRPRKSINTDSEVARSNCSTSYVRKSRKSSRCYKNRGEKCINTSDENGGTGESLPSRFSVKRKRTRFGKRIILDKRLKRNLRARPHKKGLMIRCHSENLNDSEEKNVKKFTSKRNNRCLEIFPSDRVSIMKGEECKFACSACSYASNYRSMVKLHIRRHIALKPFKCDLCDYASVEKSHLIRHMRVHTGDRPHKCPSCPYACIQKLSLVKHLKRCGTSRIFT